ncbi:MAG TPA: hypothetical protein V6D17_20870 [Candidatus Obscuribacterales bacterium]
MSMAADGAENPDEIRSPIIGDALRVLNSLEAEGIVESYAIGGSIGLLFYVEPLLTDDLDIFCHIPQSGLLASLAPVYKRLEEMGYQSDGECISIEGVRVQFLLPPTPLVEEALQQAIEQDVEDVRTRVFRYEYLLAVMAETNRPRDRAKIAAALDSADPDQTKLTDILTRYNLLDRWRMITR